MSGATALVVAPEARIYDHGLRHPLRPLRVLLTWDLIAAYGSTAPPACPGSAPSPPTTTR